MKMRLGLLLIILFLMPGLLSAQEKKRLSQDDYASWNMLGGIDFSPDGNWVMYQVNPQQYGDGNLIIKHLPSGEEHVIPRGSKSSISPGGKFAVFHIQPEFAVERQARVDGKRPKEMPADSIGFFVFETRELEKYPAVSSYQLPDEESDWVAYVIDNSRIEQPEEEEEAEEGDQENDDEETEEEDTPDHKELFVYNPTTGFSHVIDDVEQYLFSPNGDLLTARTEREENDSLTVGEVLVFDLETLEQDLIESGEGDFTQLNVHHDGDYLTWLHSGDTIDEKVYDLYMWERRRGRLNQVVDIDTDGMPEGHSVSEFRRPQFSKNGERLFFGTAPKPEPEPEDTLLDREKYSVDVWHWQDPQLQTIQKVRVNRDRRSNNLAVYHINSGKMVQLEDEDMSTVSMDGDYDNMIALGFDTSPYEIESQWMGGSRRDVYLVDLEDGSREMVLEAVRSSLTLSQDANYLLWYDPDDREWFSYDIRRDQTVNITEDIDVPLYNVDHDEPRDPDPYGIAGWTGDDESVLVFDKYDIWEVDPRGRRAPENVTGGYGRANDIRLRPERLDPDMEYVDLSQTQYLNAFNEVNKQSGYYRLEDGDLTPLVMEDAFFSGLTKAEDADRVLWRRSTFKEYPDLWVSDMDFSNANKLSEANPQQSEYYWGSVELVEWESFNDNEPLQGLLYLPEDFDENKEYPMLVYFYDRSSDGMHRYFTPSPSRSTINRSYCVSNNYIVFVPDITYREGFPGESAYDAIVSGTMAMTERHPFIDRDKMGLQGQSWGGYQIAYLITQTNLYAAAMAGAPVSNMVSAYGGIRWGTGMNRQFQYEQTQSRIGGTLWERPLRYIENSPIFYADKVETPLLMMHNDDDGAVPWYQGIEYFTALRRLSKPVWMLVYNDEAHNLTEWPNRMDLDTRMYQFFDYFLKDEPAPVWLEEGIPATEKGRTDGYELVE
ncbi:MAG: alpha/beta hydrolase family protein [Bacteroidales bacterium]